MNGVIQKLFHYPIKGLSAQPLASVVMRKGEGFPLDRAFGFARSGSGFDPQNPSPLPKTKFIMLAKDENLARLDTFYDGAVGILSITRNGKTALFDITNYDGRNEASKYLAEHLNFSDELQPTLHSAEPHKFTDVSVVSPEMMNAVSLINLESVSHLSEVLGQKVDPARFRGNIIFSGLPAFSELDLIGQRLMLGNVQVKVVRRTKRCSATEVNLKTAERDLNIPKILRDHFGHSDMGVYAEVVSCGDLKPGDEIHSF